jgi:hypothetical protein
MTLRMHVPARSAVDCLADGRRRKTLDWRTPGEALDELLRSAQNKVLRAPLEPGEYTADLFEVACRRLGVRQSMGWVGSCFDNAAWRASTRPSSSSCSQTRLRHQVPSENGGGRLHGARSDAST